MKCIRCGVENPINAKICIQCLNKWVEMRGLIFDALQKKHGRMNQQNHDIFKGETKRLELIWRRDKENFEFEIKKLMSDE